MLAYAPNAIQYEARGMYCHWPLNTTSVSACLEVMIIFIHSLCVSSHLSDRPTALCYQGSQYSRQGLTERPFVGWLTACTMYLFWLA